MYKFLQVFLIKIFPSFSGRKRLIEILNVLFCIKIIKNSEYI